MRKLIFIFFGLLALFLVIVGLGLKIWVDVRRDQQRAIVAVFTQAQQALTQTRRMPNGRIITVHAREKMFSLREYTSSLERISTAKCPESFRFAWLNYTQTLQRAEAPFSGLGSVVEFGVSVVKPSGAGTKDALARLDKLDAPEAWRRLETVALHYGVRVQDR